MSGWNSSMFGKPDSQREIGDATPAGLRFRLILPLGQLLLCAILLWPIRAWIFYQLHVPLLTGGPPVVFRYGGPLAERTFRWAWQNSMDVVKLLNLPAGVVTLPYAIFSASHTEWMPVGIDSKVWRAVTWPLVGAVFWWIAGRGLDASVASRRRVLVPKITWTEAIIGFLFMAGGITLVVGFVFFATPDDRHDLTFKLLALFSTLWAFLGSLSVFAKISQWRLQKRLAASQLTLAELRRL